MVLLNLSKAFDSIDNRNLLHKLVNVGASPMVVKWFESYLSGRNQVVRIGSSLSSQRPVTHGVPKGAVLFSVAFLYIYINDLPSIIQTGQLKSYVDDSKLLLTFLPRDANIALGKMKRYLFDVARWCCEHTFLINPGKTKFLIIGTRQLQRSAAIEPTISFLGEDLIASAFASDLGVILGPKDHISYIDLLVMFKCINGMAPEYLSKNVSTRSSVHDRETRNRNNLDMPIFKTSSGQRTFKYRAKKLWNELDSKFKDISSFIIFKKQLKQYMLSNTSLSFIPN